MIIIGLMFKFGDPHQGDKKYFNDLKTTKGFEDIRLQIIDWRYKPEDEKEFFKSMPEGHIKYCSNDFYNLQREKYLQSISLDKREIYKDYKSNAAMMDALDQETRIFYQKQTGRNLDEDAREYYTFTTGMHLDEAVNDYFDRNKFDALYLPGADFDPKAEYCQDDRVIIPPDIRREEFERRLVKKALEKGIPVLGVCSGSWLIASCFAGGKTQALTGEALVAHKKGPPEVIDGTSIQYSRLSKHRLAIKSGTLLHGIVENAVNWEATPHQEGGVTKTLRQKIAASESKKEIMRNKYAYMSVNSTHWRVVMPQIPVGQHSPIVKDSDQMKECEEKYDLVTSFCIDNNNQLTISAIDPKHLTVEAIETRHGVPVMGVQFHVESRIPMLVTKNKVTIDVDYPANRRIIEAFVDAGKTHANKMRVVESIKRNGLFPKQKKIQDRSPMGHSVLIKK